MNKKEIQAIAREAAKSIKTEQDLNDFSRIIFLVDSSSPLTEFAISVWHIDADR